MWPNRNAPTDAELIGRVLGGDTDSFEDLVRRYQTSLHRYALGMLGDRDVATDVVQDGFIKAYTQLGACRDTSRFDSWLFRIVRNAALDRLKSRSRKSVPIEDIVAFAPDRDGPETRLENAELGREVWAALERLPEIQREAFLLKHVEGLSYEEIAERLQVSISALKMRVKRAREELQESLRSLSSADV